MVAACPFPYVPNSVDGSCTTTFASAAGSAYIITQTIWLIISIPLFLIALIQNIRLWRIKGVSLHLFINNLQHQIYGVCMLSSLFIMIRGADPHGWGGKFWRHDIVLTDCSTIFAYTLLTLGACSWLKIIREISGKGKAAVETFQRVCIAVLTGSVFILSLLKAHAHPAWVYSNIILFVIMIYNATLITIAWIYGYRIQQHLSRFSSSSNNNSAATSPSQTTTTIKTPSREKKREGVTAHRKTVLTILKLLAAMTGVSILAIAFQWLGIIDSFNSHYDYTERPLDVPNFTFGGILMASIFVIAQAWCVAVALFFFRGLPTRGAGGATSSSHPHESSHHTIQTGKGPTGTTVGTSTTPRTIYQDDSRVDPQPKRVASVPVIEPATTLRSTPTPIPNYAQSPYTPAENSQRSSNGATSSSTPIATASYVSSTPPGIPARLMFPPPPPPQPFQSKPISNHEIDIEMV